MDPKNWPDLLTSTRWAALGTVNEVGTPHVSNVACAIGEGRLLIHVSNLAAHTGNLISKPVFSLLLSEPDSPEQTDPQLLARLTISGTAEAIPRNSTDFSAAAQRHITQFPESEMRFGFADFYLIKLIPESGNFVGGFAKAVRLKGEKNAAALV